MAEGLKGILKGSDTQIKELPIYIQIWNMGISHIT